MWTSFAARLARPTLLVGLLVLTMAPAGPARAADPNTVRLTPVKDNSVAHPRKAHRYKGRFIRSRHLEIGGPRKLVAILRFRLNPLPDRDTHAVLRLYVRKKVRRGLVVRRAQRHGARFGFSRDKVKTGRIHHKGWISVDVTDLVTSRDVVLLAVSTRSRHTVTIASREATDKRPGLVLRRPAGASAPAGLPGVGSLPVAPTSATPCGLSATPPAYKHVVWIVMENKGFEQIGASSAPYINSLVTRCGLATNFMAESHPSLPNYIAMTSGSTQGISDDSGPSSHPLNVPSIFSQLGADWRALAESSPSNCARSDSGLYAVRHVPSVYYTNVAGQCANQTVPLSDPPDLSAKFTFITPNECDDMHSCPSGNDTATQLHNGDTWLAQWMPKILDSPEYRAGNTAVFLTWDEDDYSGANQIATLVVSPSTPAGAKSATRFDHYSMLRTTEELLGLPPTLGAAANASSMRGDFRL
jgi:hypothetical protein